MKQIDRNTSVMIATILFEQINDDLCLTTDDKIDAVISIYEDLREGRADHVLSDLNYSIENAEDDDDVRDLIDLKEYITELIK